MKKLTSGGSDMPFAMLLLAPSLLLLGGLVAWPMLSNTEAERLVDALFRQLKQIFPASAATNLRTEADEAAAKQQWILAFAENDITKREQLAAGMKRARACLSPFWPSPGQFINWCRQAELQSVGLPTVDELIEMLRAYCERRGYYDAPEAYPWDHPAHYWLVTRLYSGLRSNGWSQQELYKYASEELGKMAKRIISGELIPKPRTMIHASSSVPLSKEESLLKISELRAKYFRKSRVINPS
ncbi:DNA replication protein [Cronobacter sakazakii]|nr:DNA replication protein [Cronobacter sakazakii]